MLQVARQVFKLFHTESASELLDAGAGPKVGNNPGRAQPVTAGAEFVTGLIRLDKFGIVDTVSHSIGDTCGGDTGSLPCA